jgi:sugar phosphate isomerase/epimerase
MKGISLGIGPVSSGGAGTFPHDLARIRGWGYDAVEPLIAEADAEAIGALENALAASGLGLSGLRTGQIRRTRGLSFADPDAAVRRAAVEAITDVIRAAARFPDAKVLNGMIQGPPGPGVTIPQTVAWVGECLRRCLEEAERLGVEMCLEPLNRYDLPYHNTLSEVAAFIRDLGSPRLTILADTFHMNIEERDIAAALREHSGLIGAVHFMDSTRGEPGTGHLDMPGLYRVLLEVGYRGYLTVEIDDRPDFHEVGPAAARYLRRLMGGQ